MSAAIDDTTIKPCPFCGHPAKETFSEGNQEWWIQCGDDSCEIAPISCARDQWECRKWWNKRADIP